MQPPFDPYHKWLGIPPAEQPPDLYRLLGIPRFEADPDVISNASDQRMAHLRTFQTGRNAALSQQLLNQLAAARVVLLHPEKRVQYDTRLRGELEAKAAQAREPKPAPATQGQPPAPAPRASTPEPSTSERLNALFDNLSVEEKAALGKVRRSLGRTKDGHGSPLQPLDPRARQRRRQLAIGGLIAATAAVGVVLLSVVLPDRLTVPETVDAQETVETIEAAGSPADSEAQKVQPSRGQNALEPPRASAAVLILRWPEAERADARLTIDGLRVAPTHSSPAHVQFNLSPGEHRVRILRDGYLPFDENVTLEAGASTDKAIVWQPVVESDGTGLWAEYFNGRDCEQLILRRIDPNVQFIWGTDSPEDRVPADDFSARWTGYLKAPFPGRYKLRAIIDDFMQVWIDGNMVLWGAGGTNVHPEAEVELTGRPQTIKIEYWEGSVDAVACLNWLPPGDFVEQAIPPEAFFSEKSVAEKTSVPESILRPAPSGEPPALVVGQPVDVLQCIDPDRHTLQGRWWFDGASLVCCREQAALIELPCPLPEEYEVRMTVERLDGRDALGLNMTAAGRTFTVVLNGVSRGTPISGVELIDGNRFDRTETLQTGWGFINQQSHDIHCTVRKSRLVVHADSETIIDWHADYRRCGSFGQWFAERLVPFSLGTWNSRFRISKLELIPFVVSEPTTGVSPSVADPPDRPDATSADNKDLAAVPDAGLQQQSVDALKEEFHKVYSEDESVARLALSARLIQEARRNEVPVERRYVMLAEASRIAADVGDAAVALAAVDEMARQFRIDHLKCKADVLTLTARRMRDPAYVPMAAVAAGDLARHIVSPATYDALLVALRELDRTALRLCGAEMSKAIKAQMLQVVRMRDLARSGSAARMRLQEFPADPDASRDVGLYLCLARARWEEGIAYLAKGADVQLAEAAAQLLEYPDHDPAQAAFGDAWWRSGEAQRRDEAARALYIAAARHWYRQALAGLDGDFALRARQRLASDEPLPDAPFRLDLNGLAGIAFLLPTKVSGEVRSTGGFGTFFGRGRLDYDRVPASSYVHEFEMSFETPSGSLEMVYGEPHEGAKVSIWWDQEQQKFRCRAYRYRGGTVWWGGDKYYQPRTRLSFTVYANEGSYRLFLDERPQLGTGVRPMDLRFRMWTGSDTMLVVASNTFRPWTEADAALLRTSIPPTRVEADWGETAVLLNAGTFGLPARPDLSAAAPYVVASSGTPMEWVQPGSFRRIWSEDGNAATSVRITRGFWIGRHEVSRMEWARVMGSVDGVCRVEGSPFLPIDGVSWSQAAAFCQALIQMEQKKNRLPSGCVYRLPTEAEWEYACRSGLQDDFSVDPEEIWSAETSGRQPREVAAGAPNAWNLHDMHGNVSEWCLDNWTDAPDAPPSQSEDPVTMPKDTRGDLVVRGGAWWRRRSDCSSRARECCRDEPGGQRGFRIVLGPIVQ